MASSLAMLVRRGDNQTVYTWSALTSQPFDLHDETGQNTTVTLDDVNLFTYAGATACANYGAQIGAAVAILVVMVMLTKHEKRRSPIFVFNSLALVFCIVQAIMQILYYTGAAYTAYSILLWKAPDHLDKADVAQSTLGVISALLAFVCLMASLILQIKAVCVTLTATQRLAITLLSIFVALVAVGFRMAQGIQNIRCNIIASNFCWQGLWLQKAMQITETISICFFAMVFCIKLGWAIHERHKLGLTQFGPMQIIFIGGCQTLVVPALFTILQFASPQTPYFGSNVLVVTAISLPLSSLWASAVIDEVGAAARGPDAHRKFIVSLYNSNASSSKMRPSKAVSSASDTVTDISVDQTPQLKSGFADPCAVEKDLEMQELGKH